MSGGATAFAVTTDAAAYVPYAGAESALASLEEWACDTERPMRVLRGPHGSGKSMLLAVLAARVGRYAVPVRFSANGLDPETLARTVLDALGTPWEGTPRVALVRAVEQPGTRRVLLLLDDADALAPRTEMWLFDFVRRSAGAVHVLLAVREERLAAELANAFQSGATVLALDVPMSREEADAWVRAEFARSGADAALRARFDAPTVARLHTRSGGVPGRLREESAAILAELAAPRGESVASDAREESAAVAATPPPVTLSALAIAAAAALRPSGPRPEPAPREIPVTPREPAAPLGASATDTAPAAVELTRFRVGLETPSRGAPRRDSVLRWLLVPTALAAAYIGGFLSSQTLDALRRGVAPAGVAVEVAPPPVSAPPPRNAESPAPPPPVAEIRTPAAYTPPLSDAAPTNLAMPAPAGDSTASMAPTVTDSAKPDAAATGPATAPEVTLPAVSAAAPPASAMPAPASDSADSDDANAAEPAVPDAVATEPAAVPEVDPEGVSAAPPSAPARRAPPPGRRSPSKPRNVEVSVEAEPGASILVNGQAVGSGTVKGLELAPGPHLVEVRLPDGRVVERVIDVKGTHYIVKVR